MDAILEKDVPVDLHPAYGIVSQRPMQDLVLKSGDKVDLSYFNNKERKRVYLLADKLYSIIDSDFSFCEKPIVYVDEKYDKEGIYSMYATFKDGAYLPVLAIGLNFSKSISDAILLSMMAHEVGHLLARHSPLITSVRVLQEDVNRIELKMEDECDVLLRNSLYRKLENEADLIELYFLKKLGFSKEDAKDALRYVISKNEEARELLAVNATHISLDERIQKVDTFWDKIENGYVPEIQSMSDRGKFFESLRLSSDTLPRYRNFLNRENLLYDMASIQVEEEIKDLKSDTKFSKFCDTLSIERRNNLKYIANQELQLYSLERTTVHPVGRTYRKRFLDLMDVKKDLLYNLRISSL